MVVNPNGAGFDPGDDLRSANFDAEPLQLSFRLARELLGVRGQNARTAFDQNDAALLGLDLAELVGHGVARDFGESSSQFDAGWAASDDHELQVRGRVALRRLPLRQLESEEDPTADFEGIFDGLQTWCERFPFGVPEVGVGGSGSEDEIIEIDGLPGRNNCLVLQIEIDYFFKQYFDIGAIPQNPPDWRGNLARGQASGRYLIKERLKCVVILAIDDGNVDRQASDLAGGGKAAEARSDNDDFRFARHSLL